MDRIENKIIEVYYSIFSTCIVYPDRLTICSPESTEHFNSISEMYLYMLDEIQLTIENDLY